MRTPLALLLSASLTLGYAASASAQQVDAATRATARQLGEEGMASFDQGDCTVAANKLTRAHDLVHVPTLAFYAGKCLEKLGRLVEAGEIYLDATRDPVDAAAPAAVKAAQADADKARRALLPRIPSVQLTLPPAAVDAQVTLDGKPVPPAMIGVMRPLDPGAHTAQVLRGGALTKRSFTLQESDHTTIVLEVPSPGAMPPPGSMPPPAAPPMPYYGPPQTAPVYYGGPFAPVPPSTPPVVMQRRSTGLMAIGIVLVGVGTIMLLGGAALALTEANEKTSQPGSQTLTHASTFPGVALLGVGLVGITGGIIMAVIGGKKIPVGAPPAPVSFEPLLGPGSAGLRVRF